LRLRVLDERRIDTLAEHCQANQERKRNLRDSGS
jgi:hypothetical protein